MGEPIFKEHIVGQCPNCESIDIDYGAMELNGGFAYYPGTCNECGTQFKEWYNLVYRDASYQKKEQEKKIPNKLCPKCGNDSFYNDQMTRDTLMVCGDEKWLSWEVGKSELLDGDECHYFCSKCDSEVELSGTEGVILVEKKAGEEEAPQGNLIERALDVLTNATNLLIEKGVIKIDRQLPTVSVDLPGGQSYFFQGEEAEEMLREADNSILAKYFPIEAVILWLSKGWG